MSLSSFRAVAAALVMSTVPFVSGLTTTSAFAWGDGYGQPVRTSGDSGWGGYGGNQGSDGWNQGKKRGGSDDWNQGKSRKCDWGPCSSQSRNQDDWNRGRGGDNRPGGWNRGGSDGEQGRNRRPRDNGGLGRGQADGYGGGATGGGRRTRSPYAMEW